jgi:hypothetical protein
MASVSVELRKGKRSDGWRVRVIVRYRRMIYKTFRTEAAAWAWGNEAKRKIEAGDLSPYDEQTINKAPPPARAIFYNPRGLLSLEDIVKKSSPLSALAGVYFLIRDGEIIYVGQSVNVHNRVGDHVRYRMFDRVYILPCDPANLLETEAKYIHKFRPVENLSNGALIFPPIELPQEPVDFGELSKKKKRMARPSEDARSI